MPDTEVEFRKKDREYFDLLGRTAGVGEWLAKIIEYRPAAGPTYFFRLQYEDGPKRGEEVEVQRHEFYVLPQSAPVVTDEAVEAAARVDRASRVGYDDWESAPERAHEALLAHARAVLEAAAPLLGPRPLLDRDALGQVLISFGADVRLDPARPAEMFGMAVDAVMELARPMPTREQIELLLLAHMRDWREDGSVTCKECGYVDDKPYGWPRHQSDAVLALINGGAE